MRSSDLKRQAWPRLRSVRMLAAAWPVLLLAASSCSKESAASRQPTERPSTPVLVAVVQRQAVPVEILAFGNVEASATASIRSQVAGALKKVYFHEGDYVTAGQMMAQIDARGYQASLEQAQANLGRDIAQADYAVKGLAHVEELLKRGYSTQDELDQARSRKEALAQTVEGDRAAVRLAKLQVDYCSITTPQDGRAGSLMIDEGNLVKANDAALVIVMQVEPIFVSFSVPQQLLPQIRREALSALPVEATVPGDKSGPESGPAVGELSFIDNNIDLTTGMIRLKATFPNKDRRLWPGQFVSVIMRLATQENAVVAPSAAIGTGQDGQYAFVVAADMTVRSRPVKVEREQNELAVISSGLAPGERVVTDGQYRLVDGAKITIKKDLAGKPATMPASRPGSRPGPASQPEGGGSAP